MSFDLSKFKMIKFLLISFIFLHFANSMSIISEKSHSKQHNIELLERLNFFKKNLKEKLRNTKNVLDYVQSYIDSTQKLLDSDDKIEVNDDLKVLSKIDVWLDADNENNMTKDVIEGILNAALHDRFKRSPRKGKRSGEVKDEEKKDDDVADKKEENKSKSKKSRKGRKGQVKRKSRH